MATILFRLACAASFFGVVAAAQAPPRFEVATIRPSQALQPGRANFSPGRVSIADFTLQGLIGFAYRGGGTPVEITGGPDWIDRDRYSVLGQAPENPNPVEIRLMMQTLLAERFALKFHTEQRQVDVYALVLATSDGALGPKVRPFKGDCTAGGSACSASAGGTGLRLVGQPMSMLATMLSAPMTNLGRRVVDRTGRSGRFDMTLEFQFTPAATDAAGPTASPSLFTVLQEQIGVKLEPSKGDVTVIVVDHAEQPSEN